MKYDTALRFWRAYIKMANRGKAQVNMPNPAIDFTARVHAGDFDGISDIEYEDRLDDTEDLSSFWDGSRMETAGNVLLNAMAETEFSDYVIEKIAGIFADASVRTEYCPQGQGCSENALNPDVGIPAADGLMKPDSSPHSIYSYLNRHIYGQEAAKRAVSMLMHHHLRGNSRNIVMAGPSGCGKTEIWRALSKTYNCIRIINGPQLSCDGWKGSYHLKDIFWDEPKETAEHLIIVIDEADKLFEPVIASGGIGFCQPQRKESRIAECTEEDLVKHGNVRRKIAGRINRIVTLAPLDADDFEAVMESPASPIRKIKEAYHISLNVDKDTHRKLASDAAASGPGCRYIRSVLLSMLDRQMFDSPDAKEYALCYD